MCQGLDLLLPFNIVKVSTRKFVQGYLRVVTWGYFFWNACVCLSVKLGFVAFTFSECGSLIFVKVNLQGLFFSGARVCLSVKLVSEAGLSKSCQPKRRKKLRS